MVTSLNAPTGAHAPFPSQPLDCDAAAPVAEALPEHDTSAARIAALSLQLMVADEAARRHLAGELHDGLGAELTAARFAVANVALVAAASTAPANHTRARFEHA